MYIYFELLTYWALINMYQEDAIFVSYYTLVGRHQTIPRAVILNKLTRKAALVVEEFENGVIYFTPK